MARNGASFLAFVLRRILLAVPVLWAVVTATFFLAKAAPGGPFDDERAVSETVEQALAAHYGLDLSLWEQYLRYLGNLLQGDLGPSFKYSWSVNELIWKAFPVSLELGVWALLIALMVGVPLGCRAAWRQGSWEDAVWMGSALAGIALPTFVVGPLLLLAFSIGLGWFDPLGWDSPGDRVLPALTLGLFYAAYIARLSRAGMLETLSQPFMRTARAKGLSEGKLLRGHALRVALVPVVAYLGPAFAHLVTGSFVIETIFLIPGLGRYFIESVFDRDYGVIFGTVVFYATVIVLFNLMADVLQAWLHPKVRESLLR